MEIVGGEFIYPIEADTARGGFQLCPADACAVDPETGRPIMPPGATLAPEPGQQIFSLREGFDHPIIEQYQTFAQTNGIEVCGIEFIESSDGRILTYDVNTNTNYNATVEQVAPRSAPRALARYLRSAAESLRGPPRPGELGPTESPDFHGEPACDAQGRSAGCVGRHSQPPSGCWKRLRRLLRRTRTETAPGRTRLAA